MSSRLRREIDRDSSSSVDKQGWLRLAPSANARSLAVLRIATGVAALPKAIEWATSDWNLIPEQLWHPPSGTAWAIDVIPISSGLLRVAGVIFLISIGLVLLGYRARLAAVVAVVAGVYAGWIPHFGGKVDHYHHLIWFLALLALSPCEDSLAVRRDETERKPAEYALPALTGVILLGIIYLSSGLPKLLTGLDWALSENVRNLMWNLWWEKQYVPPLPVDRWPMVYQGLGLATIAFELFFLPAALFRKTRVWVRWIGLGFHFGIRLFLAINFWSLAILYVVLFDWGRDATESEIEEGGSVSVAPLLLVFVVAAGAFTFSAGWPVASYPGFGGIAEPTYVGFEFVSTEGTVLVTRSALADEHGPHKARPMAWIAVTSGNEEALLNYVSELSGEQPGHYYEIRVIEISTEPQSGR